jgi:hypothetical protein
MFGIQQNINHCKTVKLILTSITKQISKGPFQLHRERERWVGDFSEASHQRERADLMKLMAKLRPSEAVPCCCWEEKSPQAVQ